MMLQEQNSNKIIQEGQKLVSDIQTANQQTQMLQEQEAQKQALAKQQEDLMNIAVVQNNLGALANIGSTT